MKLSHLSVPWLWQCKLMQIWIHCIDMTKLWYAKIKRRWANNVLSETWRILLTFLWWRLKVCLERKSQQEFLCWFFHYTLDWLHQLYFCNHVMVWWWFRTRYMQLMFTSVTIVTLKQPSHLDNFIMKQFICDSTELK